MGLPENAPSAIAPREAQDLELLLRERLRAREDDPVRLEDRVDVLAPRLDEARGLDPGQVRTLEELTEAGEGVLELVGGAFHGRASSQNGVRSSFAARAGEMGSGPISRGKLPEPTSVPRNWT